MVVDVAGAVFVGLVLGRDHAATGPATDHAGVGEGVL